MSLSGPFVFEGMEFSLYDHDVHLPYYGGNKVRKLLNMEAEIHKGGYDAIVTTGGIQSNHCRVVSLYCAKKGLKSILVLHGNRKDFYAQKGNALLMRMAGAECRFVSPSEIGNAMDMAMNELEDEGYRPYYLYGGGHTPLGVEAYVKAAEELTAVTDGRIPDYIFLACGTGSTQAGLVAGLKKTGHEDVEIHGISIARSKKRGREGVKDALKMAGYECRDSRIHVHDDYLFGGYGKNEDTLIKFINRIASKTGVITDPFYTGKALYGMADLVKRNQLSDKKLLFWHTGGIFNLMN